MRGEHSGLSDATRAQVVRLAAQHYGVTPEQLHTFGSGPRAAGQARAVAQSVLRVLGDRLCTQAAYFHQNAKTLADATRRLGEDGSQVRARDRILAELGYVKPEPAVLPTKACGMPLVGTAADYAFVWHAVAEQYCLSVDDLRSKSREAHVCRARQMVGALLSTILQNIMEAARMLDLDHSTVTHGIARVQAQPSERRIYEYLIAVLPRGPQQSYGDDNPLPSLITALSRLSVPEAKAARSYILVDLLGEPPHTTRPLTRYGGLLVLRARPELARTVVRILHNHNKPGAAGLLNQAVAGQGVA